MAIPDINAGKNLILAGSTECEDSRQQCTARTNHGGIRTDASTVNQPGEHPLSVSNVNDNADSSMSLDRDEHTISSTAANGHCEEWTKEEPWAAESNMEEMEEKEEWEYDKERGNGNGEAGESGIAEPAGEHVAAPAGFDDTEDDSDEGDGSLEPRRLLQAMLTWMQENGAKGVGENVKVSTRGCVLHKR